MIDEILKESIYEILFLASCILVTTSSCSIHREINSTKNIAFYGADIYRFYFLMLDKEFTKIKGKYVLYKDSYIRNFGLYYSPIAVNSTLISVPQINCYSVELDFSENEGGNHNNHVRCRYFETRKYYANEPGNFYEIEGLVPKKVTRDIALSWYKKAPKNKYITVISKSEARYTLWVGGDACIVSYDVFSNSTGDFEFKKQDITICS